MDDDDPDRHSALPMPGGAIVPVADDQDRRLRHLAPAAIAVAGHALLLAVLSTTLRTPVPPVPGSPMEVTIVSPGIPSNGAPDGDATPRRATAPSVPEPSEDPRPAAPDPVPEPAPAPTPAARPSPTPTTASAPSTAERGPPSPPSTTTGTGALAVGATTHGTAKGLDARLAAVIGQAVATRMRACWTPPSSGVPLATASRLVVRYAPDGSFLGVSSIVRVVDQSETTVTTPDAWESSAVDALRRCSPLGLPPALYPYWREVEVQLFGAPAPASTGDRP